jgi:lysophospholipase L1-like esterase
MLLLLLLGLVADPLYAAATDAPAPVERPVLYVIGDSTAAAYPPSRYPLFGWAQVLDHYFDTSRITINDRAISGRSAKSFYDEGHWETLRDSLKPGDFVFIQFGHNDQKKQDPKRYTEPYGTYTEYLKRYIDDTRKAGASPVLLTSINRNSWDNPTELRDSLGDYPDAVRRLARAEKLPLIDLHRLTERHFQKLGQERSTRLFINLPPGLYPNYPEGKPDNTHLQEQGAYVISELAVKAIRKQRIALRKYLKKSHRSWGGFRRLESKGAFD